MNFLALLGWSYDDKTTVMSRHELIERFSLDRVGPSPATFDYEKLDWLNGVHLRALPPDEYAHDLLRWLARAGHRLARGARPRDGAARPGEDREALAVPRLRRASCSSRSSRPAADPATCARRASRRSSPSSRGRPPRIEEALRALAERLGQKPREAFEPIRLAVTGSKVSPGLFESLELLGKEESLERLSAAASAPAQAPG